MPLWSYEVINLDTNTDMTKHVVSLELEDTGNEEFTNATITLSAKNGRYLTKGAIIDKGNKVFVKITDKNNETFSTVLEIVTINSSRNYSGLQVRLFCSHQSRHIAKIHVLKPYLRSSGVEVVEDICNSYNDNRGSLQPFIEKHTQNDTFDESTKTGNMMSKATYNTYNFDVSEGFSHDRILQVIDKLASPVSAGGEFEFYNYRFVSDYNGSGNIDKINLSIFPKGHTDGAPITIRKGLLNEIKHDVLEMNSEISIKYGTNVMAWGDKSSGTYPTDYSRYLGEKDKHFAVKNWQSGIQYKPDMRVGFNGSIYKCTTLHDSTNANNPPNGSFWSIETFSPSVSYSPLSPVQYWKNNSGGHIINPVKSAVISPDVIIRDTNHPRTWVDYSTASLNNIPNEYKMNGSIYDGFRVLVMGNSQGFSNEVVQWSGDSWESLRGSQEGLEVYVFSTGQSLTFKDGIWKDGSYSQIVIGTTPIGHFVDNLAFDCVHEYDSISNGAGLIDEPNNSSSSVDIVFTSGAGKNARFAGLNFAFPFPRNSSGSVLTGEKVSLASFDMKNMHQTHDAKRGFNQGISSEDYGVIQGVSFFEKLKQENLILPMTRADFKMAIWFCDKSDNVVVAQYTHPHNDVVAKIDVPIGAFKIHRSMVGNAFSMNPEVEKTEIFDWRNVVRGGIYTMDSYNGAGQYVGGLNPDIMDATRFELSIDGFRFVKPLLVTSNDVANEEDVNYETKFLQRPLTFSYAQLKNDVQSFKQVIKFSKKEFPIKTTGKCDVKWGDSFYYNDDLAINETVDGHQNTIKLVARKIIYSISKTSSGSGGFLRTIIGERRITVS
ncbi:MAG: hypothetical protein MAG458_00686 [Nitrosopumilus sp.]|nr:hypothetical protein [Nitrosopumilus sp.]